MATTYRIWFASGDPYRNRDDRYTPAEAAAIVQDAAWAEIDADGDLILSEYRSRAPGHHEVHGHSMADRLRKQAGR